MASGRRRRPVSDIFPPAPARETGCRCCSAAAASTDGAGLDQTGDSSAWQIFLFTALSFSGSIDDGGEIALHQRAAIHVHLQRMTGGTRMFVRKHLQPFG